jgi:ADP-ribose pyrophosphatase
MDDPRPRRDHGADDGHLIETRVASECVFEGKLLHVRRDRVRLPDGGEATREYIVHPGAVLVVPVLADGRLVVERQFRYPLNRVFIEFPAGKLDPGETPCSAANRRGTGYRAALGMAGGVHRSFVFHRADRDLPGDRANRKGPSSTPATPRDLAGFRRRLRADEAGTITDVKTT